MDDDTRDLIRRLCLRAGSIMEDASLLALTMPAGETGAAAAGLAQLDQDTRAIARLVAGAVALSTRAHQHAGRSDQGDPVRIDRVVTHEGADDPHALLDSVDRRAAEVEPATAAPVAP